MRTYTEAFNFSLSSNSVPYSINNGSPYLSGGRAYFYRDSFINKDTIGSYVFAGNNYIGNYAISMNLNMGSASADSFFTSLVYGAASSWGPAVARVSGGLQLTWGVYGSYHNYYFGYDSGNVDPDVQGMFDGRVVPGTTGTLIILKRPQVTNASLVAAHFIDSAGNHYASGWNIVFDQYKHNQLGVGRRPTYAPGTTSISGLDVADSLTDEQIEDVLLTGIFPSSTPAPIITPAGGPVSTDQTITMSLPAGTTGWDMYYTIDGSTPTNASTPYVGPFILPINPGDSKQVRAISYNSTTLEYSPVTTRSYVFTVPRPPVPVGGGGSQDAPLEFSGGGTPPVGIEYVYTQDGSSPTLVGNPALRVWSPGTMVLFDSWTLDQVFSPPDSAPYARILVRTASRHIATGLMSAESVAGAEFYFGVSLIEGLPESGAAYGPVTLALSSLATQNSRIFVYEGTAADMATAAKTELSNPGSYTIPWTAGRVTYTAYNTDSRLTLTGQVAELTFDFEVGAPIFDPTSAVSLSPVEFAVSCPTPDSVIRYTLDGTVPTVASPLAGGTITVPSGAVATAMAFSGSGQSAPAQAEVFPEYEITAVATTNSGVPKRHYYETTQRLALLTDLGCAPGALSSIAVNATSTVNVPVDGATADVYMWDVGGSIPQNIVATNAALTELVVRNGELTRHWSRLCLRSSFTAELAITVSAALKSWLTNPKPLLTLKMASRKCLVTTTLRISGGQLVAVSYVDFRGHAENPAPNTVTTDAPIDGQHVMYLVGSGTTVSIAFGFLQLVSATCDLSDPWWIEVCTGAVGVSSPAPISAIPVTIDVTAAVAYARRAPLSLVGTSVPVTQTASPSTQVSTVTMVFDKPLNPVLFAYQASDDQVNAGAAAIPRVGFSRADNGVLMAGNIGYMEYMKYAVDVTKDFSVEVEVDVNLRGYFNTLSPTMAPAHVTLQLSDPEMSRHGYPGSDSNVYASYAVVNTQQDMQAQVQDANGFRRVNYREKRNLRLKIERSGGVLRSSVLVDGLWVDMGENAAPSTTQAHVYVKYNANRLIPNSKFVMRSMKITGVLSRTTLSNAALTGIEILSKGKGAGITTLPVPELPLNTSSLLIMNRTTGAVEVATMRFDPSDTTMVLGVFETDHLGVVAWTPLASSRTIRCREETDTGLQAGQIIGVGTKPDTDAVGVRWYEAGCLRHAAASDLTWHAPDNQHQAWTLTRLIHGVDRHKITLSVVAGRQ